jgi:hypothetical protein
MLERLLAAAIRKVNSENPSLGYNVQFISGCVRSLITAKLFEKWAKSFLSFSHIWVVLIAPSYQIDDALN